MYLNTFFLVNIYVRPSRSSLEITRVLILIELFGTNTDKTSFAFQTRTGVY